MSTIANIGFPVWDAPDEGRPHKDPVSTSWNAGALVAVCLSRTLNDDADPADLSVWSTLPDRAYTNGLSLSALLPFTRHVAEAGGLSIRRAAEMLNDLAHAAGEDSIELSIDGQITVGRRYVIPITGDWVVVASEPNLAVCVAGRAYVHVPTLRKADLTRWATPLQEQMAQAREESRSINNGL